MNIRKSMPTLPARAVIKPESPTTGLTTGVAVSARPMLLAALAAVTTLVSGICTLASAAPELPVKKELTLQVANQLADAAQAEAEKRNATVVITVVDDGGYPIVLERMDGARITGPQIAWNKAFTAAGHKRSTHLFNQVPNGPALPGNEAFGIQWSFEGKFAVFVGGFPIVVDDEVVGGVGLSGGNGEQDTQCGVAALRALQELLRDHRVLVAADIKK